MYAIYKILNRKSDNFDLSDDLKFVEKTNSINSYNKFGLYTPKYELLMNGWCFCIHSKKNDYESLEYLIIDLESERIKRRDIIRLVRTFKLEELLS